MLSFAKFYLILPLLFFGLSLESLGAYLVVDVVDGDTLWFLDNGKKEKLRLSQIDAPEKKQKYGMEAKNFLENLVLGKQITINFQGKKDRYGRYLGEVMLEEENINKLLVRNGLAWVYDRYVTDETYYLDLIIAKDNKINIWSSDEQISPWQWRREN
jgi:micrococcal nuclease